MVNKKSSENKHTPATPVRKVDALFADYADYHTNSLNRLLHYLFVPVFCFGLFTLVWALPFPHLNFLGKYNGFINWASFLIAFSIYYYYKLSPVLSYFVLFTFFGFSYLIIQLEQWQKDGGPLLLQIGLLILIIALGVLLSGYFAEKSKPGMLKKLQFLLTAPVFLWHLVLKKIGIKY